MPDTYSLMGFLCLALLAEILGTVGGFGSSVFFVPFALFFFDFYSVLGITAIFHLASNISKIALFRKGLNKRLMFLIGIPSVLFVVAGSWLSNTIQQAYLEIGLGVFLMVLSLVFLLNPNLTIQPTKTNAILGGSVSGFLAGLVGTGGAIRGITMVAFNLPKEIFVATSATIDFTIDLTRSGIYAANGYIHQHDLYLIPFLIAISFVGTFIGKKILAKIPEHKFKTIVLLFILVLALVNVVKFIKP